MRKPTSLTFSFSGVCLAAAIALSMASADAPSADAAGYGRQYYGGWSYNPTTTYHYCRYNYRPVVTSNVYRHHYVIYYPSRPRYRYYYNPVRRVYWGRFEVDENGKAVGYSLLKPDDRKSSLEEIPDSAFPKAGKMPPVPESEEDLAMEPPPLDVPSNDS